jgi:hypothetical protein
MRRSISTAFSAINGWPISFENFGPAFTGTIGHMETNIKSSVAGLMLLRATVHDLDRYAPGTVILSEVHTPQADLLNFVRSWAFSTGLEHDKGWMTLIRDQHRPLLSTLEMTRKLEQPLYDACAHTGIPREYYPHVAAVSAMKLVAAGVRLSYLTLDVGKGIVSYYIVAGSKTVPYPLPARDE